MYLYLDQLQDTELMIHCLSVFSTFITQEHTSNLFKFWRADELIWWW